MYKKGDTVRGVVDKLVFGGSGVVRVDGGVDAEGKTRKMAIFVEGVVPGDEVDLEIFSLKRNLAMGRVTNFVKRSEKRIEPRCKHFLKCGGCSWQFMSYEDQLKVKEDEVKQSLVRIGGFATAELDTIWKPIMLMENPWFYRNKMDFSFSRQMTRGDDGSRNFGPWQLGLHMKGRFYDVCEIEECYLFRPWVGEFLKTMRDWLAGVSGYDGEFVSLIVRRGSGTGEVMVNLQVENGEVSFETSFLKVVNEFWGRLGSADDKLVSVFLTHIINKKGQRKEFREKLLWGAPVFKEILKISADRELIFEVAPQAFLQPNTMQAERFYGLVRELAGLSGAERVFDLYCGTGTIGICLADKAAQVTGIEMNAPAVENAKINAQQNKVANIDFAVGDVRTVLPARSEEVDLVVVDPPRAGLHEDVIQTIVGTKAKRVIYVSCNPSTLARDLKIFVSSGFQLKFIQPVDQFCHTYHVETVVLLERTISL